MTRPSRLGYWSYSLAAWIVVFVVAFPLLWMVLTSVKPQSELFAIPPSFFPKAPTLEHYATLLNATPFPKYFRNSVVIALGTIICLIPMGNLKPQED